MNRRHQSFLLVAIVLALFAILGVLIIIGGFGASSRQIDEPVARGGTLWATRAYTTSTMTISTSAITISNASFGWSATDIADAEVAYVSAHTAGVIITWDGNDPTTTQGMPITQNSTVSIQGTDNVGRLKFIRSGGSDATVSVTLEK